MNLTELQVELRTIEEHIAVLHGEIEKMKPQTEEEKAFDFEQITRLAKLHPMKNESILGVPEETKKLIFSSMSYILCLEETDYYSRILYLCRLAEGCEFHASAEDLYKMGLEFDVTGLHKLNQEIAAYRYPYVVELLIMANLSKEASAVVLTMIADFANELDISKEEIRVLGMVSKSVLTNDLDSMFQMPVPGGTKWSGKLREYITEDWLEKYRAYCGKICMSKNVCDKGRFVTLETNIQYCVEAGSFVKKGEMICEYGEYEEKEDPDSYFWMPIMRRYEVVKKTMTAPCNGIVYFYDYNTFSEEERTTYIYRMIFICSCFDTSSELLEWYKEKGYKNEHF